jgi:4-hydroxybenzoate polyprenyltransferase
LERRVQSFAADPLRRLRGGGPPDPLGASALPLDPEVIDRTRAARDAGRRTVLVTAESAAQAQAVADDLDLFDDVIAEAPEGKARAERIEAEYGPRAEIAQSGNSGAGEGLVQARLRALRPHQWSKNVLIFLPLLAAHDFSSLGSALAAFAAFSLTASSVYVLNDIADLAADRAHPRKRHRPFASGDLSIPQGVAMAASLIVAALALALAFTPLLFLAVLAAYYVATFAYSFALKRKLVLDVITLAALYTIRIVAGAAATGIVLSPWMLGFSMFLFLALAAVKRQAELMDMLAEGDSARAGRGYVPEDLPVVRTMALAAGYAAVLVFALYISSENVAALYMRPEALWLVCPLLLYWISRMVMVTHRGLMTDDPIVYAASDRASLGIAIISAGIFLGAGIR